MVSYVVYKDKLQGEYLKAFDQIETYAKVAGVGDEDSEEMLSELLDTLYQAQRDGKGLEKIIGRDVEQFCKSYFF